MTSSQDHDREDDSGQTLATNSDIVTKLREAAPTVAEHLDAWVKQGGVGSEANSLETFLPRLIQEAQAALDQEKAELAIVMATPQEEAVLILDSMGIIKGVCKHSVEILGRDQSDLIGMPIDAILEGRTDEVEESAEEMAKAARGERVRSIRTQEREDGSTFESKHTVVAVVGPMDKLSGFARRIEDISERRLHEIHIEILSDSVALLIRQSQ